MMDVIIFALYDHKIPNKLVKKEHYFFLLKIGASYYCIPRTNVHTGDTIV